MVRLKERYLLVNILYPEAPKEPSRVPDFVVLNQPTTDSLTPQALARGVRAEVDNLFGDYGSGAVERSLSGMTLHPRKNKGMENLTSSSEVSV